MTDMKTQKLIAGMFCLATLAIPATYADTVADTPDAVVQPASGKVGAALVNLPLLNAAKPNTSVRYYIYLCSAGWCGPCNREMPHVVEAYKEMKESGLVELILVDFDRTREDAIAFINKYGVTFPALMAEDAATLPGYVSPRGIPTAIIVNAEGQVMMTGHGSQVLRWKDVLLQQQG